METRDYNIKYVKVDGVVFISEDDVIRILQDVAGTEPDPRRKILLYGLAQSIRYDNTKESL